MQKLVAPPAVMLGWAGAVPEVTTVAALGTDWQPAALETCTVYEPTLDTLILDVVAPLDQRYELAAGAVNVTVAPLQIVVEPLAVIVG